MKTFKNLDERKLGALIGNCTARGFVVSLAADRASALNQVVELLPPEADVSTGGSVTLSEIGLIPLLEESHPHRWRYRRAEVAKEPDEDRRRQMRRKAACCDWFVGSVNALALTGEAVCIDYGGTRVCAYAYGARNVIWVVGVNKVTDTLDAAVRRVREEVFPLEDERVRTQGSRSRLGKTLIVEEEVFPERIRLILVDEVLGF